MSENNPLQLHKELTETLQRYISTTLPIARRYPELKKIFKQHLAKQELVNGPFLESLPDFEKGKPLFDLLESNDGFMHDSLENLPEDILERPLHLHQEEALKAACKDNKNLIVATGTGSGKTETFLYPLANLLLNDPEPNAPGIRCLLIYPMNALANDQLYYRIAPLFGSELSEANITFGRYTSQTPNDPSRAEEEAKLQDNEKLMDALGQSDIPSNWLLTRPEMLENPPKILVTNYAMLEHLLLLPRNAPLFANSNLKCIVLDEIHTYSGAQATEVAFLLRKLKSLLGISNKLQVFGTSASFPQGENNDTKILKFASELFGETVDKVVRGRREAHYALRESTNSFSLDIGTWEKLGTALKNLDITEEFDHYLWEEMLEENDLSNKLPSLDPSLQISASLEKLFSTNTEIRKTSNILESGGVQAFEKVANKVFEGYKNEVDANLSVALSGVIHIGMLSRKNASSFPLLPARYHMAANSIEGACVLPASTPEGWSDIKLLRNYQNTDKGIYYPLLVCRKCGQPYIEGFESGSYLYNRHPQYATGKINRKVYWLGLPPDVLTIDEEDEIETSEDEANTKKEKYKKTIIDSTTGIKQADGDLTLFSVETREDEEEHKSYVHKCPACGGTPGGAQAEIVTHMHPGNEALGSVVVQKVLDNLPARTDSYEPLPLNGRNLLTFSDNRQNAAFFAPYFERTAGDLALRTAIIQVINKSDESMDLEFLAEEVHKYWRKLGQPVMLDSRGGIRDTQAKMRDILLGKIAAEFCTPSGRRNSLEALGLIHVSYDSVKIRKLINEVKPLIPEANQEQTEALIAFLLENIRREKAIGDLYDLDMTDSFIWGAPYANHRSFEVLKLDKKISHAWTPQLNTKRHNRRTWYMQEQLAWTREETIKFLNEFWEIIKRLKILIRTQPGFGLNGRLIRFENGTKLPLYQCKTCGLLQSNVVDNRCTAYRCTGEVHQLSEDERNEKKTSNHYIYNYLNSTTTTARAREHTASLSTDLREKIEQEFAQGKVNVLSCTTTMEMGVDLGDLEAVVNLNVPPSASSYQQRTGRAGRRAQAAPFCITVARNSQYDQSMFNRFQEYLQDEAPVPFISLENPSLFRRHQNGIILRGFLRHKIQQQALLKNALGLNDLFGESFNEKELTDFKEDLNHWIESSEGGEALTNAERLVDMPNITSGVGLKDNELRNYFRENIEHLAQEVHERWQQYSEKKQEALDEGTEAKNLGKAQYWTRLGESYMRQFLVNQFSQRSLIPTYSFPTHSLTLEVTREHGQRTNFQNQGEISLSRDASLGISEYAPGAEVIANGRIWQSAGLAQYPRMFMPTEYYGACRSCQHVDIDLDWDSVTGNCSQCGESRQRHAFIIPKGFVTSYADRNGKDPGSNRRRERPADEARLISVPSANQFEDSDHPLIQLAFLRAQPIEEDKQAGRLFIVNRGPYGHGYHVCSYCNHAEAAKKPKSIKSKHKEPLRGESCKNDYLVSQDFAHIFDTDVLLLEFNHLLPEQALNLDDTDSNDHEFYDRFARTLAEAIRFAATDLLHIPARELRATFRMKGVYIQTILYDSVAGGAGYCIQLHNDIGVKQLLEKTLEHLHCAKECTSACSSCLCDYSNQKSWDLFDRIPVLEWLKGFVGSEASDPWVEKGAIRWERPNLTSLTEALQGHSELHLLAEALESNDSLIEASEGTDDNDEILKWIINWLNQGKKLHIHLSRPLQLETGQLSSNLRRLLRHFYPYVEQGRLTINRISKIKPKHLSQLPRIFVSSQLKTPVWISSRQAIPLFETLLPSPIYRYKNDENITERLDKFLNNSLTPYRLDELGGGNPIDRYELKAGEARNISKIFSVLDNAYIDKIMIRDPYCGTENGQSSLIEFLIAIKSLSNTMEKIEVHCRESHHNDTYYKAPAQLKRDLEVKLKHDLGKQNNECIVKVHKHAESKNNFHDRIIEFSAIDEKTGLSVKHTYDLTGGIDYLMDQKYATKIFHYQSN